MNRFANFCLFQAVWLATLVGVGAGILWIGPVALTLFVIYHFSQSATKRADALLVGAAVLAGLWLDTFLFQSGLLVYKAHSPWTEIAPFWVLILWANFALILNSSLKWLQGRYLLGSLLGLLGGPVSYWAGVRLSAATIPVSTVFTYTAIAVSWAVVVPALLYVARKVQSLDRSADESSDQHPANNNLTGERGVVELSSM